VSSNYGLGVATHIAIDHARAFGYGIILRVDADGQHPIESIPDLVRKLIDEGLDAVVGERTNRDDGSGIRSILAKSIRTYISFVVRSMTAGKAPEDVNSGFMAIGAKAAERLSRTMLDRYPEPQILTILGRSNLRTGSLQVQQLPRKKGRSSIGWFDGMRIFYRFNVFALGELIQGRDKP
jgi:glycosyltransferase involved in cell wall biosynthesis